MATDRRAIREIVLYGVFAGVLIVLLRLIEYRYLVLEDAGPIYGGIVAVVFVILGIRLGQRLTKAKTVEKTIEKVVIQEVLVPAPDGFVQNARALEASGITKREMDILSLIAEGLSNREIAERLFMSENTVKTHASRLFDKLNAKRRTQAVEIAKRVGLIP